MLCPILSAISSALTIAGWARAYKRASARAKAAEERAAKAEQDLERVRRQREAMTEAACRMRDERDAAGFAHAAALRDIAEARHLAGMPATASPQDIVRALLARQN